MEPRKPRKEKKKEMATKNTKGTKRVAGARDLLWSLVLPRGNEKSHSQRMQMGAEGCGGASAHHARARRRRLPAKPEVIPGTPGSRPNKRSPGAPGIQPVLPERKPPAFLCVLCGSLRPLRSSFSIQPRCRDNEHWTFVPFVFFVAPFLRSEEHTSELQ